MIVHSKGQDTWKASHGTKLRHCPSGSGWEVGRLLGNWSLILGHCQSNPPASTLVKWSACRKRGSAMVSVCCVLRLSFVFILKCYLVYSTILIKTMRVHKPTGPKFCDHGHRGRIQREILLTSEPYHLPILGGQKASTVAQAIDSPGLCHVPETHVCLFLFWISRQPLKP